MLEKNCFDASKQTVGQFVLEHRNNLFEASGKNVLKHRFCFEASKVFGDEDIWMKVVARRARTFIQISGTTDLG